MADTESEPGGCVARIEPWLFSEGRLIQDPRRFCALLAARIVQSGLPLRRLRISLHTLNPLVIGKSFTWWREQPEVEVFEPLHAIIQTPEYLGSPIEAVRLSGAPLRCRPQQEAPARLHSSVLAQREAGVTDYLVLPLRFCYDPLASTLILSSDQPQGFSDAEVAQLIALAGRLAPVLEVMSQEITMQSLLTTYLGPRAAGKVRGGQVRRGDSERIQAVIWYSDLRGSTALTERLPEAQMLELVNDYFALISDSVTPKGGEVLRFVGDAMLVIFPIGAERGAEQAAQDAIDAVEDAERRRRRLNRQWRARGVAEIRFGLGLDFGELVYGNVGALQRLDFTVMGAAVNRAARIETLTKSCAIPVLLSAAIAALLPGRCRVVGQFPVPGVAAPLTLYRLRRETPQ